MLKKLCWQLNYLLTLLEISSPSKAQKVRDFSRLLGGGGAAQCKSQFFSRLFPKEVVLRYGCPLLGTHILLRDYFL